MDAISTAPETEAPETVAATGEAGLTDSEQIDRNDDTVESATGEKPENDTPAQEKPAEVVSIQEFQRTRQLLNEQAKRNEALEARLAQLEGKTTQAAPPDPWQEEGDRIYAEEMALNTDLFAAIMTPEEIAKMSGARTRTRLNDMQRVQAPLRSEIENRFYQQSPEAQLMKAWEADFQDPDIDYSDKKVRKALAAVSKITYHKQQAQPPAKVAPVITAEDKAKGGNHGGKSVASKRGPLSDFTDQEIQHAQAFGLSGEPARDFIMTMRSKSR